VTRQKRIMIFAAGGRLHRQRLSAVEVSQLEKEKQ